MNLSSFSKAAIDEICERVRDKKFEVRKIALIGLGRLYYRHVSSKLKKVSEYLQSNSEEIEQSIPSEIMDRLEMVPSIVLKSWGYPDFPTKHLVLTLLQEYLLPKAIEVASTTSSSSAESDAKEMSGNLSEVRTSALILLFKLMKEDVDKASFGAILQFKAKIAEFTSHFLRLKTALGNGSTSNASDGEGDKITEIKQLLFNLTQIIPINDRKQTVFDKLILNK
jgi:hypothetical protein